MATAVCPPPEACLSGLAPWGLADLKPGARTSVQPGSFLHPLSTSSHRFGCYPGPPRREPGARDAEPTAAGSHLGPLPQGWDPERKGLSPSLAGVVAGFSAGAARWIEAEGSQGPGSHFGLHGGGPGSLAQAPQCDPAIRPRPVLGRGGEGREGARVDLTRNEHSPVDNRP